MDKPKIVIEVLGGVATYELYGITEEEIEVELIDYDLDEEDEEGRGITDFDPNGMLNDIQLFMKGDA